MKKNKKQILFSVILVFLVVGFLEIALRLLAPAAAEPLPFPIAPRSSPNPAHPGHDRLGFRIRRCRPVPTSCARRFTDLRYQRRARGCVAKTLASMTGQTVYSRPMADWARTQPHTLGGGGCVAAEIIIEAFTRQRLFDSFDLVYNRKQLPDSRLRHRLQGRVRERAVRAHRGSPGENDSGSNHDNTAAAFLEHSKIYELLPGQGRGQRRAIPTASAEQQEHCKDNPKRVPRCSSNSTTAVPNGFHEAYRHGTRSRRSQNRGGCRSHSGNAEVNKRRPRKACGPRGADPHQGRCPQASQSPTKAYRALTDNEARMWRIAKDYFERNGIEYLDALPALQAQLTAGNQPYPVSQDGHPNGHGYRAIAELVAAYLQSQK